MLGSCLRLLICGIFLSHLACFAEPSIPSSDSFNYKGWQGALRLQNEALEIVIVPQTGRLVHLSTPGEANLLNFDASLVGILPPEEEGDWLNYGGDWVWAVHQTRWGQMGSHDWPPPRELDRAHWHSMVEIKEDGESVIHLRRDIGAPVFARLERTFTLPPGNDATLTVSQSITRIQASDIPVTLWQITQMANPDWIALDASAEDFEGRGYHHISFEDPGSENLVWEGDALIYDTQRSAEIKIGTLGEWVSASRNNKILLLRVSESSGQGEVPDQGCQVVTYANSGLGYVEIETQSDEVALAPGEVLQNQLTYRLLTMDEDESPAEKVKRLQQAITPAEVITFSPEIAHPQNTITVKVQNKQMGGSLHWGVNSPEGNWQVPAKVYWPQGTLLAETGKAVETPLPEPINGVSTLELGPFNQPEQVVNSLHAVVRWGDTWESKEGQNYNLNLVPHPEAAQATWQLSPPEAGSIQVQVSTTPEADQMQLYVNDQILVDVNEGLIQAKWDAGSWAYGPQTLKVRMMKDGFLSIDEKRIWKIPNLKTVPNPPADRAYGASVDAEGMWQLTLFAPSVRFVAVEWQGTSGNLERQLMQKTEGGHWLLSLPLKASESFAYRYIIDGYLALADPWSVDVVWKNPAGGESYLPQHAWSLAGSLPSPLGTWDRPDPLSWVIYECSLPDTSTNGSYLGLVEKLDYIQGLGINAIEPLPVTTFPGAISWGYNPAFHMAIERSYGGPDAFATLIQESRKRGIAYIADLVLNHIDANAPLNLLNGGPASNPYTMEFAQFNWGFPKLDQKNPALKRYIQDTLTHWVTFWGVDGFRYDATQWIKWNGYNNWGASWMSYVVNEVDPNVIQVAENLPSEPNMVKGTELDGEWDGHYRWRMRKVFSEAQIEEPEKMREILDPRNHAYQKGMQRVPYIESHDEERFVRELLQKGYSTGEAFMRHQAAAAITLTVPGMPMLYAGQEWGEMTEKVVGPNPLQWQLREQPARAEMLARFKELIELRVSHRALHQDRIDILHLDAEKGTVAYLRPGVPESILVAFNVSKQGVLISLDVNGEVMRELYQPQVDVDLSKLSLRPGQARVFVIKHPIEAR